MQRIIAREIVGVQPHDLYKILPPQHILVFDDGKEIQTTRKETFYSSFCWELLRHYPDVPIYEHHHVKHTKGGKPLNTSTHISLMEAIQKDIVEFHNLLEPKTKEKIQGLICQIRTNIYNEVTPYAEEHIMSLDILDFIEVVEHPKMVEARAAVPDDVTSKDDIIKITYDKSIDILMKDPSLLRNNLSRMARAKLGNINQIVQCVVFRGFGTEVDGRVLQVPIMSNFTQGMYRLYDYVAESRSAAKSYYFAEAPLEDAEYFARRLRLLTTTITHIHYQDCGTERYLNWLVRGPVMDEKGKMVYPGDLKYLRGKKYLEPESKVLKTITGKETHLYNKMIRMRSVLYCKTPNKHAVCHVCFGDLHHNVSAYANLGHLCAATMTQQTTQSVLSTKHLDASSRSADIVLTADQNRFFRISDNRSAYVLKKEYRTKDTRIIINRDQAVGLADAMTFDSFDTLNFQWISSVADVDIMYFDGKGIMHESVKVGQEKRKAVFTPDFLKYIKQKGWETNDKGNFVFDLSEWNTNLPILSLPEMEYSYSDHSDQIAKMIESNLESMTDRVKPNSPATTLQELFAKVNDKLNMNIAPLEVIMAAIMVPEAGSIRMGRGEDNAVLGVANQIVTNRCLSNAYGYKDQVTTFMSSASFFSEGRPDSIYDTFFAPKEVVAYKESLGQYF